MSRCAHTATLSRRTGPRGWWHERHVLLSSAELYDPTSETFSLLLR